MISCDSCGANLTDADETCAFCGSHNSSLPKAEVPVAHQSGEGRVLTKTYDDSLRSIQAGVDYSQERYQIEVRRSKFGVWAIAFVLAMPMLFLLWVWHRSRPERVDFEKALNTGVESVRMGDYAGGQAMLLKALQERPNSTEANILHGSAHYAETLEKPEMEPERRKKHLYACHLGMHAARQTDPGDPRANFFMALTKYEAGDIKTAIADLKTCLANLSKIPESASRQRYSVAATAILQALSKNAKAKLVLVSQVDESRTEQQKSVGIEVPFER